MGNTESIITSAPEKYQSIMDNYVSILEKTNNQLGLWNNISSLSVGILSVFIAVIAIFVGYYLWKNSKDQKDLFKNLLKECKKTIDDQSKILMEQKRIELDKIIKDFEKTKESVTEEKKAELQEIIDNLKKEKESVTTTIGNLSDGVDFPLHLGGQAYLDQSSGLFNLDKSLFCIKCGRSFTYKDDSPSFLTGEITFLGNNTIYCPYCGSPNIVQ